MGWSIEVESAGFEVGTRTFVRFGAKKVFHEPGVRGEIGDLERGIALAGMGGEVDDEEIKGRGV